MTAQSLGAAMSPWAVKDQSAQIKHSWKYADDMSELEISQIMCSCYSVHDPTPTHLKTPLGVTIYNMLYNVAQKTPTVWCII